VRAKDGGHDHQPAEDGVQHVRAERVVERVARHLPSAATPQHECSRTLLRASRTPTPHGAHLVLLA